MTIFGALKSIAEGISGPQVTKIKLGEKEAGGAALYGPTASRWSTASRPMSAKISLLDQDVGYADKFSIECLLIYFKASQNEGRVRIQRKLFRDFFRSKMEIKKCLLRPTALFCFVGSQCRIADLEQKFSSEFFQKAADTGADRYPLNSSGELSPERRGSFRQALEDAGFSFRDYASIEETERILQQKTVQAAEFVDCKEGEAIGFDQGSGATCSESMPVRTRFKAGQFLKSKFTREKQSASVVNDKPNFFAQFRRAGPFRRTLSDMRKSRGAALRPKSGVWSSARYAEIEIRRPASVHDTGPERSSMKAAAAPAECPYPDLPGSKAPIGVGSSPNSLEMGVGLRRSASMRTCGVGPYAVEGAVSSRVVRPASLDRAELFASAVGGGEALDDQVSPLVRSIMGLEIYLIKVEAHIKKLEQCCGQGDKLAGQKADIWKNARERLRQCTAIVQTHGLQGEELNAQVRSVQKSISDAKEFLAQKRPVLSQYRVQFWNAPLFYLVKSCGFEKFLERRVTSIQIFNAIQREQESCVEQCELVKSSRECNALDCG